MTPQDWEEALVSALVVDIKAGDWGKAAPDEDLIGVMSVRGTDFERVDSGVLEGVPIRYLTERRLEPRTLRAGDLLVEMSGGSAAQATGRALLVTEETLTSSLMPLCYSNFVKRLRIETSQADPDFFFLQWLYLYRAGRTRVYERRTTGIRNFKLDGFLANEVFSIPPLSEQRAIAQVLRTVQRAREQTEQVIAAARELKRSMMRHLFTYGPVAVGEVSLAKLTDTATGAMPIHWEIGSLGDIARIERGKFSHRPRNDPEFYGGRTPFIQTGDVTASNGRIANYSQTLNEKGLGVSRVFPAGTIVITIAANIGYAGILEFDSAFPDSLIGITPEPGAVTEYVNYYLETQQPEMDRKAPRGTQKNINIQFLTPWPVKLPPLNEQAQIVNTLARVDAKVAAEEQRRDALDALFGTLLHDLMTAKLRVQDLDLGEAA